MPGKLKGQFFIAGALSLCVIFFLGLPALVIVSSTDTSDLVTLSDNLEKELPHSMNIAVRDSGNPADIGAFLDFIRTGTDDRLLDMEILWVVVVPDESNPGDIDVHAGNWLGRQESVTTSIDSQDASLELDDREIDSASLSGVSQEYDMAISFGGRSWTGTFPRDKTSMYVYLSLERGTERIVKDISG